MENGTIINQYKIISAIGKGGMGEVFLAEDTKLDRKVALKILPSEFAEDKDRMSRFVREAKSASALNHPNIITIYEIGEREGIHFIATEFIDGKTLNDYKKANQLNYKSALEIAIQVASALDEAHLSGIIHRDIKPDNVMVRANGLVKILDFGIAKLSESVGRKGNSGAGEADETAIQQPSTSPGMIIGTANYMSAEQAKGEPVDARSDIFSFGVVLYEMLSGHLPFEGKTPMEIIGAIIHKEPKPLENSDVPPEIERIIGKTLRKDRNERYQTIKDVLIDLRDVKRELDFQDNLEKTVPPSKQEPQTQIWKATTYDAEQQTTTNDNLNDSITIKKSNVSKSFIGVLAVLLISVISLGYWFYSASASKQIESIAVMPFVNESKNENVEYLSDGMTETLIKSLSNLPNLNVKPRSSVFRYKGKDTDLKTIAKELNVEAILSGRVIQRDEQLTLSLELVDVRNDKVLWTESYQRKQSDLVSLQSEIAKDVSSKLKSKLSGAEEAKVTKTSTVSPDAYQAYLKGRYYWNRRTGEDLIKAMEQFNLAVQKDPNYALAYVGLAHCYAIAGEFLQMPSKEYLPNAKAFATKALEIDDSLGEAYATLGQVNRYLWNWAESEKAFKRSIELNPNYATARHWYSRLLAALGRKDEALAEITRANEIDPLSRAVMNNISQRYQEMGNYQSAIEQFRKMIEIDPDSSLYFQLASIYLDQKRSTEALAEAEKARDNRTTTVYLGRAYAQLGRRGEALAIIRILEERFAKGDELNAGFIASVHVELGDKEKTFEWLEKAFQVRDPNLPWIRIERMFDPIRDDPRYKDLIKRMNLPE